jgi:hypothetical protein
VPRAPAGSGGLQDEEQRGEDGASDYHGAFHDQSFLMALVIQPLYHDIHLLWRRAEPGTRQPDTLALPGSLPRAPSICPGARVRDVLSGFHGSRHSGFVQPRGSEVLCACGLHQYTVAAVAT